jgi:hypothetical protein
MDPRLQYIVRTLLWTRPVEKFLLLFQRRNGDSQRLNNPRDGSQNGYYYLLPTSIKFHPTSLRPINRIQPIQIPRRHLIETHQHWIERHAPSITLYIWIDDSRT